RWLRRGAGRAAGRPPGVEPATRAWLDQLAAESAGSPPIYELSPPAAREVLRSIQASVPVELPPADIDDRVIPGGPSGAVEIRVVRPRRAAGALPILLHCHGGGWVLGDRDTTERLDRELANAAGAVVMLVAYTPAPEARYPLQNEQAYAALEWAVANAAEVDGDPGRVALLGDSAGGNMAAALALMARS